MLYNPFKIIGINVSALQGSFLAIERIADILSLKPAIVSKPGAKELKNIHKSIEFKNVNFEYVADTPVLKNISLKV